MAVTGQLWFTTEGGDADSRIVHINSDGTSQTIVVDNGGAGTGDDKLISSFTADIGVDTSAGFYFAILSSPLNDHAYLVRGVIGSNAAPTIVVDFPDSIIVNTLQLDAIDHKIYVGYQDGSGTPNGNISGIRVYDYDPLGGAIADQGFLTTAVTDSRPNEGGFFVLDPHDFALDSSIGRLFYSEKIDGLAEGLFRLDLANPNAATQLVSQAQFPDDGSGGYIYDVEVDQTTDLVYFSTQSQSPSGSAGYDPNQNAIWYISENASSGTAVKVTLLGLPGGNTFYPGDMAFDQNTRQIYVESEEGGSGSADDVIYVFQLDGAGTTATLIQTIAPSPAFAGSAANIEGMTFVGGNNPHTGGISITGTATEDQVLTAVSTLADVDGLGALHYQWQHDIGSGYVNIGTDQATYTLGDGDVGGQVRVAVTYTDGQGFAESETSVATAAIANVNDPATVTLGNLHAPIFENASTAVHIKMADITVSDVDAGVNALSLSGVDAALFEIVGNELFLKAGVKFDFETNPVLNVSVDVDDTTIPGSPDGGTAFALNILNIAENIKGTAGNNTLVGTNNGETVNGLGGNDRLIGLGGNDRIIGGPGIDTMTGGPGSDVFIFTSSQDSGYGQSGIINNGSFNPGAGQSKRDIITDFTHGQDKIDLSPIDANVKVAGNQAFSWRGTGNFTHAPGQLIERIFNAAGTASDRTIIYGDTTGDGRADFQIELTGLKHLTASDFIL